MIALIKPIRLESIARDVHVRQLTMGDMRALLESREVLRDPESKIDMLEILMVGEGLLLSDLCRLSDLTFQELDKLNETDVEIIVAAAKEVNPRFFSQVLGPISQFAELVAERESFSSEPSSPSSESGTPTPGNTH